GMSAVSSYSADGITAPLDEGSKYLNDLREKRVKNQASKAEADMMIYLESQKTAFNKDDDYETFEERWNNGITKQMGVIANTINDADVREAFVQKYKPKVEAQRQFIRALSLAKEQDHDTADILEKSQMLQNAFATSGDPEMINRGNELFDNSKG
ncbi:MAG: hypothetical protein AB2806_03135, partial [Candidatus Thiodiazotropha sp.]